jgi:biotin operon repressor
MYRSFLNWEWYTDSNTKDVFLHLILTANYESKKWRGITVERGQRVYSAQMLATELKMSRQTIRTAISHLLETGELTNYSTPKYSIITVKNYDSYQQLTNELTNCQPTTNQVSTNKLTNESTNCQPSLNPQCNAEKQGLENMNQPTNQPTAESQQLQNQPQCNNKELNKLNNNILDAPPKIKKHKYGEYQNVLLSDADIEKLKAKFTDWQERVETLSKGIELKGYKYKNYYLAILKWAEKDAPAKPKRKTTFDIEEYEKSGAFDNFER